MTERPPAVPLPGPNVTPEPNEKIKVLAGNATVPGAKSKPEDRQFHCFKAQKATFESGKHPGIATEQPPAVPLSGPNVTPERNEKVKVLAGNSLFQGTESKPEDTLRIRKTPWHGVTEQPPAVPLPGPNVTPEPNEKIKVLAGNSTVSGAEDTLQIRKTPWHGVTEQPPAVPLHRIKKSKFWQAIPLFQGTQTKPQDTLQIRKHPGTE